MSFLIIENALFFMTATALLIISGWAWRNTKPYSLPQPLPKWFKIWFGTVQVGGGLLPIVALLWGWWRGYGSVLTALIPYLIMLGLQILSEVIALRQFHSVVWVMVPYLYLPYRWWQLYEGLSLMEPADQLIWVRYLLLFNLVLWIGNYCLDVSQLPRLFHWENKAPSMD
ncbi:MAG: hypothetical protein ACFB4I_06950 [Cyanophyceae cyanobacterium]